MAGDGSGSRYIDGQHKSFLHVGRYPLLVQVILALEKASQVDRICVVGPRDKISGLIEEYAGVLLSSKPLSVLEQKDDLYQNCMSAFLHLLPEYEPGDELHNTSIRDKAVLLVASDLPFLTSAEIDEFLVACTAQSLDYCVGMTEETYLKKYQPVGSLPGFQWNYLHLREGNFRLNNLHVIKPFKVENREYLERLYQRRHQKSLMNIVKTFWDFAVTQRMGLAPVLLFLVMELAVFCRHIGFESGVKLLRKVSTDAALSKYASRLLKARVAIVTTTIGGGAADIDSEEDYAAVRQRLDEWRGETV